jgi:hypothetical protein
VSLGERGGGRVSRKRQQQQQSRATDLVGLHHDLEGGVGLVPFGIEQLIEIGDILKKQRQGRGEK